MDSRVLDEYRYAYGRCIDLGYQIGEFQLLHASTLQEIHGDNMSGIDTVLVELEELYDEYNRAITHMHIVKDRLTDLIDRVGGNEGRVLYLRHINLISFKEIALILGYSERQIYRLYHDGVELFKALT